MCDRGRRRPISFGYRSVTSLAEDVPERTAEALGRHAATPVDERAALRARIGRRSRPRRARCVGVIGRSPRSRSRLASFAGRRGRPPSFGAAGQRRRTEHHQRPDHDRRARSGTSASVPRGQHDHRAGDQDPQQPDRDQHLPPEVHQLVVPEPRQRRPDPDVASTTTTKTLTDEPHQRPQPREQRSTPARASPPRNNVTATAETASPCACIRPGRRRRTSCPLYSVWYPATSSVSASGRSNGGRLISASAAISTARTPGTGGRRSTSAATAARHVEVPGLRATMPLIVTVPAVHHRPRPAPGSCPPRRRSICAVDRIGAEQRVVRTARPPGQHRSPYTADRGHRQDPQDPDREVGDLERDERPNSVDAGAERDHGERQERRDQRQRPAPACTRAGPLSPA